MDAKKIVTTALAVANKAEKLHKRAQKVKKTARILKFTAGALTGFAAACAVPLFLLKPGKATKEQKAPFMGRNIAHRGLHTEDKSIPENSLAAFRRAVEGGYGVELDVQLSKDGKVVVFHDATLDRVCGVEGRVDERTYAELCELRLCGTEERIPLFSDVLVTINGAAPIICELKTGKNNAELCRKTLSLIQNYSGDICIESFDPTIVLWFRLHARKLLRGQLATRKGDYIDGGMQPFVGTLLENTLLNVIARPHFIAYKIGPKPLPVKLSEAMGAMKVGWTSHDPESEKGRDTVIFEFYEPEVRFK